MKVSIIIFIVLLNLTTFCQDSNYLYWSDGRRLCWSDFQGTPTDSVKTDAGITADAVIHPEFDIIFDYTNDTSAMYAVVLVRLNRSNSFVNRKSEIILKHEQGHFDIAEIFARKLRKDYQTLNISDKEFNIKIDSMSKSNYNEYREYDCNYDNDTFFGAIKKSQDEWSEKIFKELKSLKEYTDTVFFPLRPNVIIQNTCDK